jgi:hypothetical protein
LRPGTTIRIARPTDNLDKIISMYKEGLDFVVLGKFEDHDGFDGVVLGSPGQIYHLEFTHQKNHKAGKAPTKDNLLVFYIEDREEWKHQSNKMKEAGFSKVDSFNPYWDKHGNTFEDLDGYRVVLQNSAWNK